MSPVQPSIGAGVARGSHRAAGPAGGPRCNAPRGCDPSAGFRAGRHRPPAGRSPAARPVPRAPSLPVRPVAPAARRSPPPDRGCAARGNTANAVRCRLAATAVPRRSRLARFRQTKRHNANPDCTRPATVRARRAVATAPHAGPAAVGQPAAPTATARRASAHRPPPAGGRPRTAGATGLRRRPWPAPRRRDDRPSAPVHRR